MATESKEKECGVVRFHQRFGQVRSVSLEVPDFFEFFSMLLGSNFREGMYFIVDASVNGFPTTYRLEKEDTGLTEKIRSAVDRTEPINACWGGVSGPVYSLGKGAKTMDSRTLVVSSLTYRSDKSFGTLIVSVARYLRKRKGRDPDMEEQKEQEQQEMSGSEGVYDLVVCKRGSRRRVTSVAVIDNSNVESIINREVFVNPHQQSYGNLNLLELFRFDFAGVVETDLNPDTYFVKMKKNSDETIFKRRIQAAVDLFRVEFVDWEQRIREAVAELVGWAQVIPPQYSFNEKTRRTIVYVPCKFAALLLTRPIFVETPLCVGPSPHVFHGSGPADIIIGGDDNKSEPPVIIQNVSDRMFIDNEDSDEGEDEEEDYEGAEEDCYVNIPRVVASALPQLSGQCNDIAYVPAKKLHEIAGISSCGGRRGNVAETREGPVSARVFKDISGIITTGNTWDVFHYSTGTLDLHAKPRVRYMGSLGMRVLRYKTYTETPAAPAPQMAHPSGAFVAGNVERAEVERVIAMLILSARGQLTLPIQSEAAQVVTS